MRVISGKARGIKLVSLDGETTRPTLDRVKEALFSKIQFELEGATILDLFAGSGSLGIEALSRGAAKAVLCDNSFDAIKIIEENLKRTNLKENATVIKKDYIKCLEDLDMKFDIIFIDPPYKLDYAALAVDKIFSLNLLADNGYIIVETDDEKKLMENENINLYDIKKYGRVKLMFVTRKG